MIANDLLAAASFAPASLEFPSGWVGHLPFAAWSIKQIRPKVFVELGTHSGNSYFSFCQAVLEGGLSTKCYAVDTWQGDDHAGQYTENIFAKVSAHNQDRYSGFSQLLRTTFDDAASYFLDGSVDLLHIDGLHTYEAVLHDFETWLPKLSPGAVVMFHDTNVRERNFGVWKLWSELQSRYPRNIEFTHSHGLGVLQLDNGPDEKKIPWLDAVESEKSQLLTYFASLGTHQVERYGLIEARRHATSLQAELDKREERLNSTVAELEKRDQEVNSLRNTSSALSEQIIRLENTVSRLNGNLAAFNTSISAHNETISQLNLSVVERDNQVLALRQQLQERDIQISNLIRSVSDHTKSIELMKTATSWRITKPLRMIKRLLSHSSKVSQDV